MKRWTLAVFLLLLPLTMAPRTSLTPDDVPLEVTVVVSQTSVDPGDRIAVVAQATNTSDAVLHDVAVQISMSWSGRGAVTAVRLPKDCALLVPDQPSSESVLSCRVGSVAAGHLVTRAFNLVAPSAGELVLRAGGFGTAMNTGAHTATIIVGGEAPPPTAHR